MSVFLSADMLAAFMRSTQPSPESNFPDCLAWSGPTRVPSTVRGHRPGQPLLLWEGEVYVAALVSYAWQKGVPYPFSYARMTCGNLWCVNGEHCIPYSASGRGRTKVLLEETAHYAERVMLITQWLRDDPNLRVLEIVERLQEQKLGGKTVTICKIISKCRQDLGLALRSNGKLLST